MNQATREIERLIAENNRIIAEIDDIYRTRRFGRLALLIQTAKTERTRVARWFRLGRIALLYTLVRTEVYRQKKRA